jgi:hypothetical protein
LTRHPTVHILDEVRKVPEIPTADSTAVSQTAGSSAPNDEQAQLLQRGLDLPFSVVERRTAVEQLSDVLLGNNPHPHPQHGGWPKLAGRSYDLLEWDYGYGSWSVGCNLDRIGKGTLGWIYRADGSWGRLAGLIVFGTDEAESVREKRGVVHYQNGWLWRLPLEWWIDGARIHESGWTKRRAPFGGEIRHFQNGVSLDINDVDVLWRLLNPVAQEWVNATISEVADPDYGWLR